MFFSFDGIDGVGKSTQARLFCQWLRDAGHDVVTCRDPGTTTLGEEIRRILLDPATMGKLTLAEDQRLESAEGIELNAGDLSTGDDAAKVRWFDIEKLPQDMAFDHNQICRFAISKLKRKRIYRVSRTAD